MRAVSAALLLAGCTSVPVAVHAAPGPDGAVYVRFVRERAGPPEHVASVEAREGRIADVVLSPDRRAIQVLWDAPSGRLVASFPYGGEGWWTAGSPLADAYTEYVFLEHEAVVVTGRVPAACPMLGTLTLDVRPTSGHAPVDVFLPDGSRVTIDEKGAGVPLALPRDKHGGLVVGDLRILLETARKTPIRFVIAVDSDGVVAAVSGYLRNSTAGLD